MRFSLLSSFMMHRYSSKRSSNCVTTVTNRSPSLHNILCLRHDSIMISLKRSVDGREGERKIRFDNSLDDSLMHASLTFIFAIAFATFDHKIQFFDHFLFKFIEIAFAMGIVSFGIAIALQHVLR